MRSPTMGESKAAEPQRRYKHVYFHRTKQVWQAVRKGCPQVPVGVDQESVARQAANMWGISIASLHKVQGAPRPQQRQSQQYRHVSWHARRRVWVVQGKNKYVGCSPELAVAVRLACKHFRTTKASLTLNKPMTAQLHGKTSLRSRMAALMQVYNGGRSVDDLPLDLQDLLRRRHRILGNVRAAGLWLPYLVAKFPEARDAIDKAGASHICTSSARLALMAMDGRAAGRAGRPEH